MLPYEDTQDFDEYYSELQEVNKGVSVILTRDDFDEEEKVNDNNDDTT